MAPLLAERVLLVERQIAEGAFVRHPLDLDLILTFQRLIAGELCPNWAGRWRDMEVRVGEHHPPPPYRVPMLMRDYVDDLRVRLESTPERIDETLLETLAFAEGRFLSIHPFPDFNGRVARLFLRELLRRLELPPIDLVPTNQAGETTYRAALHAGDSLNWHPLVKVWQQRFESFRP